MPMKEKADFAPAIANVSPRVMIALPRLSAALIGVVLHDYFGFIWDGTKLRFAWSDPRNGSSSQVFYVGGTP